MIKQYTSLSIFMAMGVLFGRDILASPLTVAQQAEQRAVIKKECLIAHHGEKDKNTRHKTVRACIYKKLKEAHDASL